MTEDVDDKDLILDPTQWRQGDREDYLALANRMRPKLTKPWRESEGGHGLVRWPL